jgi:formamidopyrimidine-DNA glycosylase
LEVLVPKPGVRVLRGTDVNALTDGLTGQVLATSEASEKQMVFRFGAKLTPSIFSEAFSREAVGDFLERRKRTPLKPLLLMQERFPGVGNWMADEILWRARLHPRRLAGELSAKEVTVLWKTVRDVCVKSVEQIDVDWRYPRTWLFSHRWTDGGTCPRCKGGLERAVIGGRRTCWCPGCQGRGDDARDW